MYIFIYLLFTSLQKVHWLIVHNNTSLKKITQKLLLNFTTDYEETAI